MTYHAFSPCEKYVFFSSCVSSSVHWIFQKCYVPPLFSCVTAVSLGRTNPKESDPKFQVSLAENPEAVSGLTVFCSPGVWKSLKSLFFLRRQIMMSNENPGAFKTPQNFATRECL